MRINYPKTLFGGLLAALLLAGGFNENARAQSELSGNDPYAGQTQWGTLVTRAMLDTSDADLAIIEASALNSLTREEISGELPDDPTFVPADFRVVELTGAQVLSAVESGIRFLPRKNVGFLQLNGFHVTLRKSDGGFALASSSLERDRTYRVAVSEFLAGGGGPFREFEIDTEELPTYNLTEAVRAKLDKVSELPAPANSYRIEQ